MIIFNKMRRHRRNNHNNTPEIKSKIPIVIFHKGYKDYLKNNLLITSKFNEMYLLGDKSVQHLSEIKMLTL